MRTTSRWSISVLALCLVQGGCVASQASVEATRPSPGPVREVRGLPDRVSTLLVDPVPVGEVELPGQGRLGLSIGAFYARFDAPDGMIDELALMLMVRGPDLESLFDGSRELLLDIDGSHFTGQPGESENSFRVERTPHGTQAMLAIPISPDVLLKVADATRVRGRIGHWGAFAFPPDARLRLADLVHRLPAGALKGQATARTAARTANDS